MSSLLLSMLAVAGGVFVFLGVSTIAPTIVAVASAVVFANILGYVEGLKV